MLTHLIFCGDGGSAASAGTRTGDVLSCCLPSKE
jgi:hypothetical protein